MYRQINPAATQLIFNLLYKNALVPKCIERPILHAVAFCFYNKYFNFQSGIRCLNRLCNLIRLRQRQLAPPGANP